MTNVLNIGADPHIRGSVFCAFGREVMSVGTKTVGYIRADLVRRRTVRGAEQDILTVAQVLMNEMPLHTFVETQDSNDAEFDNFLNQYRDQKPILLIPTIEHVKKSKDVLGKIVDNSIAVLAVEDCQKDDVFEVNDIVALALHTFGRLASAHTGSQADPTSKKRQSRASKRRNETSAFIKKVTPKLHEIILEGNVSIKAITGEMNARRAKFPEDYATQSDLAAKQTKRPNGSAWSDTSVSRIIYGDLDREGNPITGVLSLQEAILHICTAKQIRFPIQFKTLQRNGIPSIFDNEDSKYYGRLL